MEAALQPEDGTGLTADRKLAAPHAWRKNKRQLRREQVRPLCTWTIARRCLVHLEGASDDSYPIAIVFPGVMGLGAVA